MLILDALEVVGRPPSLILFALALVVGLLIALKGVLGHTFVRGF